MSKRPLPVPVDSDDDSDDNVDGAVPGLPAGFQRPDLFVLPSKLNAAFDGLFAANKIKAKTVIGNYAYIDGGETNRPVAHYTEYPMSEATNDNILYASNSVHGSAKYLDGQYGLLSKINHLPTKFANAAFKKTGQIITIRDIKEGGELFMNYGRTYWQNLKAKRGKTVVVQPWKTTAEVDAALCYSSDALRMFITSLPTLLAGSDAQMATLTQKPRDISPDDPRWTVPGGRNQVRYNIAQFNTVVKGTTAALTALNARLTDGPPIYFLRVETPSDMMRVVVPLICNILTSANGPFAANLMAVEFNSDGLKAIESALDASRVCFLRVSDTFVSPHDAAKFQTICRANRAKYGLETPPWHTGASDEYNHWLRNGSATRHMGRYDFSPATTIEAAFADWTI
tara:strand:+ start:713 stop:1906 length:1194 start_codon:yes stop_codon:yes gene_type:complete